MPRIQIYYEKCNLHSMPSYPSFIHKLIQIEKIVKPIKSETLFNQNQIKDCSNCDNKNESYQLGNIIWSDDVKHLIESHQSYPSDYFIKIIMNTNIIDDQIVNPPIQLDESMIKKFTYIPLNYNKLLIIDALMHQGSHPRYQKDNEFIYSEHSGVMSVKDKMIDNIIVSAESDRTDDSDKTIFLPNNTSIINKYEYIFHTHPNTSMYGGRISEGILYEFPSANDIFNFMKYHNEGKAQASLVVAPEGTYLIRPVIYQKQFDIDPNLYYYLRKFILKLEKKAIKKNKDILSDISDPNIFMKHISSDYHFINHYNKFIEPANIFIEYYPRENKNNEWCLRSMNLPYLS
jgi:hypothetical protein